MRWVWFGIAVVCTATAGWAQSAQRPQERPAVRAPGDVSRPSVATSSVLSDTEMAGLQSQIAACWQAPEGAVWVRLGFSLDLLGRVEADSIKLVSHGAGTAAPASFEAAKRAVLRCGRAGFALPVEKYEQWRDIELRFDPERTISK